MILTLRICRTLDLPDADLDESLLYLPIPSEGFALKSNFQNLLLSLISQDQLLLIRHQRLATTVKAKAILLNDCSYKKNQFLSPTPDSSSSKNDKYQKKKDKYRLIKSQRRGKGLVAEDHDRADSSDSSEYEEDTINLGLMALNDEVDLGLMAKIEDIPEVVAKSSSTVAWSVKFSCV